MAKYWCFLHRWHEKWGKVLAFNQPSGFAQCTECFRLQAAARRQAFTAMFRRCHSLAPPLPPLTLVAHHGVPWGGGGSNQILAPTPPLVTCQGNAAEDLETRFEKVREWRQHLNRVFLDRSLLNTQRAEQMLNSLPTHRWMICADGMDQAHWRMPRDPGLRAVKSLSSCNRPTCMVECVWVVNKRIDFYVCDTDQAHDSNCVCECVALTLEALAKQCEDDGTHFRDGVDFWVVALVAALEGMIPTTPRPLPPPPPCPPTPTLCHALCATCD